jgi:hypothetical protein
VFSVSLSLSFFGPEHKKGAEKFSLYGMIILSAHARNESTIPNHHFMFSGHLVEKPLRHHSLNVYQKTLIKLLTLAERELWLKVKAVNVKFLLGKGKNFQITRAMK